MFDTWTKHLRYGFMASGAYCLALCGVGSLLLPPSSTPVAALEAAAPAVVDTAPVFQLVEGKPVRIVVPGSGIDIALDEGYYNAADGSWTLSDTHAQYAMMSVLANNHSGNTFIYGHGTDTVFGGLSTTPPTEGSVAVVHTAEGHVFEYEFESSRSVTPTETSVLDYTGPPVLTVQTCTGAFSEWRTLYTFGLLRVHEAAKT